MKQGKLQCFLHNKFLVSSLVTLPSEALGVGEHREETCNLGNLASAVYYGLNSFHSEKRPVSCREPVMGSK
ncbi:jg16800 [Pararge aegeria aegeria]|uniref:Jg16800 protein n=1 Tax=Pararge aegeria aegeria TaxID=348720 RepID=A0A8S4S3S2_9NEOP|nr:jg16800 [Pararge aegeria aegeria]